MVVFATQMLQLCWFISGDIQESSKDVHSGELLNIGTIFDNIYYFRPWRNSNISALERLLRICSNCVAQRQLEGS